MSVFVSMTGSITCGGPCVHPGAHSRATPFPPLAAATLAPWCCRSSGPQGGKAMENYRGTTAESYGFFASDMAMLCHVGIGRCSTLTSPGTMLECHNHGHFESAIWFFMMASHNLRQHPMVPLLCWFSQIIIPDKASSRTTPT